VSKIRIACESLKTANYIVVAMAAAGTVLMPIPPARAGNVSPTPVVAATAIPMPKPRPSELKLSIKMPLDLAAVARQAPPELVAQARRLAPSETIGILSRQQIADFARTHPGFVDKVGHAYVHGTPPHWTPEEKEFLAAVTNQTLGEIKAGDVTPAITAPTTTASTPSTSNSNSGSNRALFGILFLLFLMILDAMCGGCVTNALLPVPPPP
jgi:hypothetical protein